MKVLGVVPARGGSKGIRRKNLVVLGGKPLLKWTLDAAKHSKLDRIIVSTDDDEIATHAEQCGIEVPFRRPTELSDDSAFTIDVVLHALKTLRGGFDAVMVLQPTSPFRSTTDINACLKMLNESAADSVISMVNVGGHHPARMKFIESGYLVDPSFVEEFENQPRQNLRPMYIRNGAIYLTRTTVLESRSFQGRRSLAYEMPSERSVNIDNVIDLQLAECLAPLQ